MASGRLYLAIGGCEGTADEKKAKDAKCMDANSLMLQCENAWTVQDRSGASRGTCTGMFARFWVNKNTTAIVMNALRGDAIKGVGYQIFDNNHKLLMSVELVNARVLSVSCGGDGSGNTFCECRFGGRVLKVDCGDNKKDEHNFAEPKAGATDDKPIGDAMKAVSW